MHSDLEHQLALEILDLLTRLDRQLVCAESCTAGLVAATLGGIPGASNHFCGSAVVYRNEAKIQWLGVSRDVLDDPNRGDVCEETAIQMARGCLIETPTASVSASVTGHLGPGAPDGLDGVVYLGWAERDSRDPRQLRARAHRITLQEAAPLDRADIKHRVARQIEATREVLIMIRDALTRPDVLTSDH